MTPRPEARPVVDAEGRETHPAFGRVRASRVTGGDSSLFDSEIRHQHYVTLAITRANRERKHNRDWIFASLGLPVVEIAMSEAQWAQLVSSMNTEGAACTIRWTEKDGEIPAIPYAPRLALSQRETRDAAHRAFADAVAALEAYKEAEGAKAKREALRTLEYTLRNAAPYVEFAAASLTEHAENVAAKARADIEAMVIAKAEHLGITADSAPRLLELETVHAPAIEGQ